MSESPDLVADLKILTAMVDLINGLDEEGKKRIYFQLGVLLNISKIPSAPAPPAAGAHNVPGAPLPPLPGSGSPSDYEDIAAVGETGIEIIAPDLKATTKKDASLRIAYLVCYLSDKIMRVPTVTRDYVYEQMKKHAAYDENNTRNHLKSDAAILKEKGGTELKLSVPGKQTAEKYIAEIRNPDTKGTYSPKRKSAKPKKSKAAKPTTGK